MRTIQKKYRFFSLGMLPQHIAAFATVLILAGALLWTRRPPIEYIGGGVVPSAITPGGNITESTKVRRLRSDCDVVILAEIVDAQRVHFRLSQMQGPAAPGYGNPMAISRVYAVPVSVAFGLAKLQVQRSYWCWPFFSFWPIRRPMREYGFEIVPS